MTDEELQREPVYQELRERALTLYGGSFSDEEDDRAEGGPFARSMYFDGFRDALRELFTMIDVEYSEGKS